MKKTVLSAILAASLISSSFASAATYNGGYQNGNNGTVVNYQQFQQNVANINVNFQGKGVDYEQGFVYATGTGRMAYAEDTIGMEDLAREAAIMDAQRNLVAAVQGARIDSETTVEMKVLTQDTISRKISGIVRYGVIVDEGTAKNGSYYVKMVAPLFGTNSVAEVAFADIQGQVPIPFPKPELPKQEVTQVQAHGYTGLIVDAQGFGLEPCMSPVIYDTNGRAIYGVKNINPDFAVNQGMVSYARTMGEATTSNFRAGQDPLVIKAVSVSGGINSHNKVNVVVSVEDGNKILAANQAGHFLEDCKVIFVR